MGVLPRSRDGLVRWLGERLSAWESDPGAIGLSAEQVQRLRGDFDAAVAAAAEAQAKRNAAAAAGATAAALARTLRAAAGAAVNSIKAHAAAMGDPFIYEASQVPPPRARRPLPPPAMPDNLRAVMRPDGAVELRWDGSVAHGTMHMVQRSLITPAGAQPFTHLGTVGATTLLDDSLPAGITAAVYQVQALRGTLASPPGPAFTFYLSPVKRTGKARARRREKAA